MCETGEAEASRLHNGSSLAHKPPWWSRTAFPFSSVFWPKKILIGNMRTLLEIHSSLRFSNCKVSKLRGRSLLRPEVQYQHCSLHTQCISRETEADSGYDLIHLHYLRNNPWVSRAGKRKLAESSFPKISEGANFLAPQTWSNRKAGSAFTE